MSFDELCRAGYRYPTVALFYGANCAPCDYLKPKLRDVCIGMNVRLEEFNTAGEMAFVRSVGMRSTPTVFVVHPDGVPVLVFHGDKSKIQIEKLLIEAGVREV